MARKYRSWSAVLAVLFLLAAACGGGAEQQPEPTEAPATTEAPTTTAAPAEEPAEPEDDFPNKEITLIIPFPAGSANDTSFRTIAAVAEQELGQPIVVVNQVGGFGTVGLADLLTAEADGYTIGQAPSAALTMLPHFQDTTYEGPEDFEIILQAFTVPLAVWVRADSPLASWEDFIETSVQEPGSIAVGVPCERCVLDLDLELLMQDVGGELQFVPYQAGEQVVAVLNGSVDVGISFPNLVADQIEAGELRMLFFFSSVPVPGADAPVISEVVDTRATVVPSTYALGPPGIPENRLAILHDALRAGVESQEFADFVDRSGLLLDYLGPEEATESLRAQAELASEAMEELGWLEG